MAEKNIAVFGIYRDRDTVERALAILQAAGFRNTDISALFPRTKARKISLSRRALKRQKPQRREQAQAPWSAEPWGG